MKLTESHLRNLIKQELEQFLNISESRRRTYDVDTVGVGAGVKWQDDGRNQGSWMKDGKEVNKDGSPKK